jgi:hypothetical protein
MNPNQPQMDIDLSLTSPLECEKCKNGVFIEGMMLRQASRLVTGTPKDAIIPIPVFACSRCQHVNDFFIPPVLKEIKDKKDDTSRGLK